MGKDGLEMLMNDYVEGEGVNVHHIRELEFLIQLSFVNRKTYIII